MFRASCFEWWKRFSKEMPCDDALHGRTYILHVRMWSLWSCLSLKQPMGVYWSPLFSTSKCSQNHVKTLLNTKCRLRSYHFFELSETLIWEQRPHQFSFVSWADKFSDDSECDFDKVFRYCISDQRVASKMRQRFKSLQ